MDESNHTQYEPGMDVPNKIQMDESNHTQYEPGMDASGKTLDELNHHKQYETGAYHSGSCHSHRLDRGRRWNVYEHVGHEYDIRQSRYVYGVEEQ